MHMAQGALAGAQQPAACRRHSVAFALLPCQLKGPPLSGLVGQGAECANQYPCTAAPPLFRSWCCQVG